MIINVKYNIDDNVYFVISGYGNGAFEIKNGVVIEIKIIKNNKEELHITYEIQTERNTYYVDEAFLFKNDLDLYKFFKENIRSFFEENRVTIKKKEDVDDLPF